ncbi:MFS transporter [Tsukamurella sp. 8F]|uniref:MFS transporter n=1 Tax=unclassified Tsukamurella TaxID=2633480 RepID=UPI0023B94D3E|nr:MULTISPECIES: MFS transporter [unclassified Tsukamurella]MDF0528515.1 MFS transporter [Tsukamurella sp. 8J]MDF0586341.1 MFS transporter [Tsukamurella sp. 8F]
MSTTSEVRERLHADRWVVLGVLCATVLLVMIDNTIVNVALPTLAVDLGAGTSGLQWVVDAYTLVFAGLLLGAGHASDRLGRKRVLLVGVAAFAAMSAVAASVTTLNALIAARAGLGAAAALVFPATLALIMDRFAGDGPRARAERAAAVGVWAAMAGIGVAVGPVAGGWLLEHYSWPSVFWIAVPYGLVALVVGVLVLPESRSKSVGRFDWTGLVLSIGAVGTLVWSVIEGPHHGWASAASLAGFGGAVVLGAALIGWELKAEHPVLDVGLFTHRRFTASAAVIAVAFFSLFGFIFMVTQYFQLVRGYGTLSAGLHTLPFAAVMAVCSPLAMAASRRVPSWALIAAGMTTMAAGFALVLVTGTDSSYWRLVIVAMSLMAAGLALVQGPATEVIMTALPLDRAGSGSAVNDTTREIGGTLGVAVLGSVMSTVFASRVGDLLAGVPMPGAAREAASSSVAAGVQVARSVPASGGAVLEAVRVAFVDAMHSATLVAAIACLAGALAAVLLLRRR